MTGGARQLAESLVEKPTRTTCPGDGVISLPCGTKRADPAGATESGVYSDLSLRNTKTRCKPNDLERDNISSNYHPALTPRLSVPFLQNRLPLWRGTLPDERRIVACVTGVRLKALLH